LSHLCRLECKQLLDLVLGDDPELLDNLVNIALIFRTLDALNVAGLGGLRINLKVAGVQVRSHLFNFTHHVIINKIVVQIVKLFIKILLTCLNCGLHCNSLFCFLLFGGLGLVASIILDRCESVVELQSCDHGLKHIFKFKSAYIPVAFINFINFYVLSSLCLGNIWRGILPGNIFVH
jgi:hypothetical protein